MLGVCIKEKRRNLWEIPPQEGEIAVVLLRLGDLQLVRGGVLRGPSVRDELDAALEDVDHDRFAVGALVALGVHLHLVRRALAARGQLVELDVDPLAAVLEDFLDDLGGHEGLRAHQVRPLQIGTVHEGRDVAPLDAQDGLQIGAEAGVRVDGTDLRHLEDHHDPFAGQLLAGDDIGTAVVGHLALRLIELATAEADSTKIAYMSRIVKYGLAYTIDKIH